MSSAETRRCEPLLVLFAEEDAAFTRGYLAPALGALSDGQPAARLLGGAELRGLSVTALDAELSAHSQVLLVLTPAFFADPWARVGEQLASFGAVGGERRVIPLRLAPCELPLRLDATAGLDFIPDEAEPDEERWQRWEVGMQRLRETLVLAAPRPPVLACPYPGLRPYVSAEAAFYFGRAAEIEELVSALGGGARELFLIGPSGSGKSSLLAAGVLPRLVARAAEQSRRLVVRQLRPGAHPTAALLAALRPGGVASAGQGSVPEVEAAAAALAGAGTELLVVIDQLEEAFAQAPPAELRTFAAALRALRMSSAAGTLGLVYALRADFFSELLQSQLWAESSQRQHNLAPLSGAALRAALEQPAVARGVYFEAGLLELLLHDAAEEPGALPLLQETLVQLWERRRQRLLSLAAYRALGEGGRSGLATALAQHADRTLASLAPARQALAKRVLLRLVAFGEGRPHTRRRQRRCELASSGDGGELGAVIDALARARLLILDSGEDGADPGDDVVDLCHDALVTAWPQLAAWAAARQADEERRRRLEAAAHEWVDGGRGGAGLLDRTRYAAAAAWLESEGAKEIGCSADATALVEASRRALEAAQRRRQRRLVITLVATAFAAAVAIVLATLATLANRRAEANHALALANERRALDEAQKTADEARRANTLLGEQYLRAAQDRLAENRPQQAIPYLVAAREVGHDSSSLRSAYWRATRVTSLAGLPSGVLGVSLSGDGSLVLSSHAPAQQPDSTAAPRGRAALWRPHAGEVPVELPLVGVFRAQLSADGTRAIATLATDVPRSQPTSWLTLWDVSVRPPRELPLARVTPRLAPSVRRPQLSADGTVLLGEVEGGVQLWSTRTGEALGPVFGGSAVSRVRLDRAGRRVAVSSHGCVAIWTVAPQVEVARTCQHSAAELVFFDDEPELAILSQGGGAGALLWRYTEGSPAPLAHDRIVARAAAGNVASGLAPSLEALAAGAGRTLLAADDSSLWRWDLDHLERGPQQLSHRCEPRSLRVARAHDLAILACGERGAQIWHLGTGALLTAVTPPYPVHSLELSADGDTLATLDDGGQAHLWRLTGARGPALLSLAAWEVPVLSDDGRWLATVGRDAARLYDVDGGTVATLELPASGGTTLQFSPSGAYLAALSRKRALRVWHVPTRRLVLERPGGRREERASLLAWDEGSLLVAPLPSDGSGERLALFEVAQGRQLGEPLRFEDALHALTLSADGRALVVAGTNGVVRRWALPERSSERVLDVRNDPKLVPWYHVNLSAEGSFLAATKGGELRIWDFSQPGPPKVLGGGAGERVYFCRHATCVVSAERETRALLYSGKRSAAAGSLERLRAWALPSGQERTLPPEMLVEDVELARGERLLELREARRAFVRDLRTGEVQSGELTLPSEIRHGRFSGDGRRVLLWSSNGQAAIWQVELDASSLDQWRQVDERNVEPSLSRSSARATPGLRVLGAK